MLDPEFHALLIRHKESAAMVERAFVVAYLRKRAEMRTSYGAHVLLEIAAEIEAGKHREGEDP